MDERQKLNYDRIALVIDYIKENFREQPSTEKLAEKVHLSPYHFHRLFHEWAGTTPKKFLQYTSLEYAKRLLKEERAGLFDTAFETGLSGTSRLHDLFISIEGMTPAEYRDGGKKLVINYSWSESPFGDLIVASTPKGICYMAFENSESRSIDDLRHKFPNAVIQPKPDPIQQNALLIFQNDWSKLSEVKLHLKGTDFQLKVWEALLKIPVGKLSTYGQIANSITSPGASRAVGIAIGSNPVAFLIPCHRVIRADGKTGGYRWGNTRKTALIGWESAKVNDK